VSLQIETFVVGPFPNNLYLVSDSDSHQCIVIDPSIESETAIARVAEMQTENNSALQAIWNTHGHLDHVYDNARWKERFGVPIWMHSADSFFLEHLREQAIWLGLPPGNPIAPDADFQGRQTVSIGKHSAQVLHTPGHSPGSVSFYFAGQNVLFGGDVLFQNSVGRTDLPGCDAAQLQESLRVLAKLPPSTRVLSGHDDETTIAAELRSNPFLEFLR
jgi:glyoxylase-like metal-dependent hydrolase (beta-lactamase superfamily II)